MKIYKIFTGLFLFMHLLIYGLAIWRLYRLLAYDHGPADLFGRLRYRLGVRYTDRGAPYGTTGLSEGLLCYYCAPLWYAAGLELAHYFLPAQTDLLATVLAIAAVATLVEVCRGARQ